MSAAELWATIAVTFFVLGVVVFFAIYFATYVSVGDLKKALTTKGYRNISVKVYLFDEKGDLSPYNYAIMSYRMDDSLNNTSPDMRRQIMLYLKGKTPCRIDHVDFHKDYLALDYTPRSRKDLPELPNLVLGRK